MPEDPARVGLPCPPLSDLLLAGERELSAPRLTEVQAHLRECAVCRDVLHGAEATFEAYAATADPTTDPTNPAAADRAADKTAARVARFRDNLDTAQRERLQRSLRVPARRWLPIAALVPLLIVGLLLSRQYTSIVHADELLTRAAAAEAQAHTRAHGAGAVPPVRVQVTPPGSRTAVRVDPQVLVTSAAAGGGVATPGAATPTVAADRGTAGIMPAGGRSAGDSGGAAGRVDAATIEALLAAHGFDWQQPLSVARFQAWRGGLARKQDAVTLTDDTLLVLKTTTDSGALREAVLTVRQHDYHVVRQSLLFEGFGRITIEEEPQPETIGADASSRAAASSDDATSAAAGAASSSPSGGGRGAADLGVAAAGAANAEAELRALTALDGRLRAQRRAAASASGAAFGVATRTRSGNGSGSGAGSGARPALRGWLSRSFGDGTAGRAYLPTLAQRMAAVRADLAAVQTLATQYPEPTAARLSPAARSALQRMVAGYYRDLASQMEGLDSHLALLLGTATRDGWAAQPGEGWQRRFGAGSDRAARFDAAIRQLLTHDDVPLPHEIAQGTTEPVDLTVVRDSFDALWALGSDRR